MTEFALLLPLLAFMAVAGVDFARVFYFQQTITNCARNGALYASNSSPALVFAYPDYKKAALADAPSLSPAVQESDITAVNGTDNDGQPNVAVTVNYQFAMFTSYLGFSSVSLSRTVTMRVAPSIPG